MSGVPASDQDTRVTVQWGCQQQQQLQAGHAGAGVNGGGGGGVDAGTEDAGTEDEQLIE